jgi:hypothetical protein
MQEQSGYGGVSFSSPTTEATNDSEWLTQPVRGINYPFGIELSLTYRKRMPGEMETTPACFALLRYRAGEYVGPEQ